ncbi:MAG: hypothetical protein KKI06_07775 [Euryarchaeota archaeon]|nr:hypothetical protein [Euryarchaeota archaeon]
MEGGRIAEIGEMQTKRYGTRMTQIGRIFTDIFNPCVSASSAQSVFHRIPPIIYDDKKPQMKTPRVAPLEGAFTYAPAGAYVSMHCGGYDADERRYIPVTYFVKTSHRKGRKERKAMQQESLRPLRSLRLNASSAPAHERAPPSPAVHLRTSRAGG